MPFEPCSGPPWASTVTVGAAASGGAEGAEPPQPKVAEAASAQAPATVRARKDIREVLFKGASEVECMVAAPQVRGK